MAAAAFVEHLKAIGIDRLAIRTRVIKHGAGCNLIVHRFEIGNHRPDFVLASCPGPGRHPGVFDAVVDQPEQGAGFVALKGIGQVGRIRQHGARHRIALLARQSVTACASAAIVLTPQSDHCGIVEIGHSDGIGSGTDRLIAHGLENFSGEVPVLALGTDIVITGPDKHSGANHEYAHQKQRRHAQPLPAGQHHNHVVVPCPLRHSCAPAPQAQETSARQSRYRPAHR